MIHVPVPVCDDKGAWLVVERGLSTREEDSIPTLSSLRGHGTMSDECVSCDWSVGDAIASRECVRE